MLLINLLKRALLIVLAIKGKSILTLFLLPMRKILYVSLVAVLVPIFQFAQNTSSVATSTISEQEIENKLESARISKDNEEIAESLYKLGKLHLQKSKTKALDYFKEANGLVENTDYPVQSELYYEQSFIYTTFSEFPEALTWGLKSLEFNKINNIEKNILRDMSHIGYIYDRMYEFRRSIDYNKEALKIAKRIDDKKGEALCYGRIGIAYDELAEKDNFNLKLFDSALYYNKKAAELSEANNDMNFARTTYSNIGNTYSKLKQFDKAEEFTLKSLAVPGYEDKKGVTLVNLGKIYLETNRYSQAKKILDSAMRNTIAYGTRKYQLEAYYRFHELDVKQGNYKSALSNYIEYKSIEDSLLNETKTKQIAEIGERFKTADKEREILIQRAEIAEQDLTIQKRNYQLLAAIGSLLLLGVLAYLIYKQQQLRNRQLVKENELKDALIKIETQNKLQEQRLRISRDLHDNIGAQLTFIISSIDNLKYSFDITDNKLKNKLNHISNFTTDTIHELRDTIWAMNKDHITFEDLKTRLLNFIDKANWAIDSSTISIDIDEAINQSDTFTSLGGINLYRVLQESINNALKHSEADKVTIEIKEKSNTYQVTVEDNGRGFDILKVDKSNGLVNMRKRIEEVNGHLTINSSLNSGTQIIIDLPK